MNIHAKGLAPGLHGVHIHSIGSCSPTFAAAGGHYNPVVHQHGLDNPAGPHAGDLPNLVVNGVGALFRTNLPPGEYRITWLPVPFYAAPAPQTNVLGSFGLLRVAAN